jgi:hypothetical protein
VVGWRTSRALPARYDQAVSSAATESDGAGAVTGRAGRLTLRVPRLVRPSRVGRYEFALVGACYLLAAIAVMALVLRDPAARTVAGSPVDPSDSDQQGWWLRYAAEAVAHWRLPALVTNGMHAPVGVNAMWNPSILAPGVALSLVTLLFGPEVSLNVMLTAGLAGSGFSLFWVLRRWGIGTVAAVAGGLAYGFSPALTGSSVGNYNLQFGVFPPLIAHFTARLVTGRGAPGAGKDTGTSPDNAVDPVKTGAALGLVVALQLLTSEELLFYTAWAVAVGLVVAAVGRSRYVANADNALRVGAGLLTASGVIVAIAGYPLWVQFAGPLTQHGSPYALNFWKNDLEGFIQPSSMQLIHSASSAAFAGTARGGAAEYLNYLGWPMLVALPVAAVWLWRVLAVRMLAVTFLVLEVLSLGGTLLFDGHDYSWLKLPWHLVEALPLASSAVLDRVSIIADGLAAALLAIAIDVAWRTVPGRGVTARRVAIGLATAIVVVPLLPAPLPPLTLPGVPAGWKQVLTALRLPPGASVLVVPVPTATFTPALRWEAETAVPASMMGGFFIGPINGQAYIGGSPTGALPLYLNSLWAMDRPASVNGGGLQAISQGETPSQAATWLAGSGNSAVVAVTSLDSPLARYLTKALGQPAARSGEVIGWRVNRGP